MSPYRASLGAKKNQCTVNKPSKDGKTVVIGRRIKLAPINFQGNELDPIIFPQEKFVQWYTLNTVKKSTARKMVGVKIWKMHTNRQQ